MPESLDDTIKALAHPLRRQILQWLKDPETHFPDQYHPFTAGVCAGQIHQKTGLSGSSASAHLALLQKAGLIQCQKIGQWHFLSRNETAIGAFLKQIDKEI
jgi:DNA-binding transcriptional ArsR family regulator